MGHVDLKRPTRSSRALNEAEEARRELWESFHDRARELDGRVWECVSSTRIYCRPTCGVHRPRFENCMFVTSAEEAEALGYRPCMRCHPELAPGEKRVGDENDLAWRARSLVREFCSEDIDLAWTASRLGSDEASVEDALRNSYGASFDQMLSTSRLHIAVMLLGNTRIAIEKTAAASGFEDARKLAAAMKDRYRIEPAAYRKRQAAPCPEGLFEIPLGYRAPYGFERLLEFFRARQLEGVEVVDDASYSRTVRVAGLDGETHEGWLRIENDSSHNCLRMTMTETLLPVVSHVIARVRRQFDLDGDPAAVHAGLAGLDAVVPGAKVLGTRVPGAFDSFEIAVRAVLGQQVSVKAANKLAARIAEKFGERIVTGVPGLGFLFPSAEEFLGLDPIEDALGELGVIKTRSRTIRAIAELVVSGGLDLNPAADVGGQMRRLLDVKGIGVWSQNYIAMRALGYTDAFLEADSGIKHALPGLEPKERSAAVEGCRPWRAYANVCLWNSLASREGQTA